LPSSSAADRGNVRISRRRSSGTISRGINRYSVSDTLPPPTLLSTIQLNHSFTLDIR
jgi:hypothetical protein